MKINVNAKNMNLTNAIREYAEKKAGKITKYFDEVKEVGIFLEVQKNHHTAEILVDVKGMFLKGYEKSEDMYASIDMAIEKIEKQLIKYKEKLKNHKHTERRAEDVLKLDVYNPETVINAPEIIVSKTMPSKPMDIDEAVMQMDLLNKNFYVFKNSKTS